MMPFCVDSSSLGNPCRFHSPIVVASVSMSRRLSFWVNGIFLFDISFFHSFRSCVLKSWLKGPQYERNPDDSRTSPTSLSYRNE